MENENTTTETIETVETPIETVPAETQAEVVEPAQPQATTETFKINYLGEEKELSFDEAKTLAQKGMDYDRQKERWEQTKPTLNGFEEVARLYGWTNQDGHGDPDAFIKAMKEAKRQEEIDALQKDTTLPKELAEELYLSRQERKAREEQQKQAEAKQKADAENIEFLKFFKETNGRDFTDTEKIPDEVWEANAKGVPLRYAYADYLSRQLLADKKIEQTNQSNAESTPGSVNGQGATIEKEFYTSEEVDRLTDEDYERNPKLWEIVRKSMLKWG